MNERTRRVFGLLKEAKQQTLESATGEFAPGIPDPKKTRKVQKVNRPQQWEISIQKHDAEKARTHFDLRLGNPRTGIAHSFAIPKAELPKPGESRYRLAIQQPDHTLAYMDQEGVIPKGQYGAGPVKLTLREKADVFHVDDKRKPFEGKIRFNVYTSRGPEEFALRRLTKREIEAARKDNAIGKNVNPRVVWALHNKTKHQSKMGLPTGRPPYREVKPRKAPDRVEKLIEDENVVFMPKLDGAHNLVATEANKIPRVFSYREPKSERPGGVIEHTHKIPEMLKTKVPPGLGNIVLRGETIAVDGKGQAIESQDIGGMLNSSVWKSRQKQRQAGAKLQQTIFDVARYRGQDMTNAPFEKKLEVLQKVQRAMPHLRIPEIARTPEEKRKLFEDIKARRHPLTTEGVVAWGLEGGRPTKVKFDDDHDVYVKKIYRERNKPDTPSRAPMAGGFEYSTTPDGPAVGRVGTGFSHQLKAEMLEHPERFIGRAAKVTAEKVFKSGRLSKPRFTGEWHLDKGRQPMEA